jgi:hypothetical protein
VPSVPELSKPQPSEPEMSELEPEPEPLELLDAELSDTEQSEPKNYKIKLYVNICLFLKSWLGIWKCRSRTASKSVLGAVSGMDPEPHQSDTASQHSLILTSQG